VAIADTFDATQSTRQAELALVGLACLIEVARSRATRSRFASVANIAPIQCKTEARAMGRRENFPNDFGRIARQLWAH
jgi:hypothetical protein